MNYVFKGDEDAIVPEILTQKTTQLIMNFPPLFNREVFATPLMLMNKSSSIN
jgi:hypothetical protein